MHLVAVRRGMVVGAAGCTLMAVASGAILFGRGYASAGATVLAAALFGGVNYVWQVRKEIPRGELREAPADLEVRRGRHAAFVVASALVFGAALAWAAILFDIDAGLVVGDFAGIAAANAVGLVQVGRWERAHHARLLVSSEAPSDIDDPPLYRG